MRVEENRVTSGEDFKDWHISFIGAISTAMEESSDLPNMTLRIQFSENREEDLIAHDSPELAEKAADVFDLEGLTDEDNDNVIIQAFERASKGEVIGLKIPKESFAYIFSEKHHIL